MKKVLIAYDSRTGKTEKMAESIAEGIRMGGHDAELKKITLVKNEQDLQGYDGYILGSPTYHRDMIGTDTMEHVFRMDMTDLGSFNLKEQLVDDGEGIRACQDYGKGICEKLAG
jgi:flavodoxin